MLRFLHELQISYFITFSFSLLKWHNLMHNKGAFSDTQPALRVTS